MSRNINEAVLKRTVERFRQAKIVLPTLTELAEPWRIDQSIRDRLQTVDPDQPDPLNLFRVHWYNDASRRGLAEVPGYIRLPKALTGVDAPILVALGERFPMITAHKVLAAYGCLVPRVVSGEFDPTSHKAIWPSTGNYCRGGVAISRIMGCRGVAVLPEGMSDERFHWLESWVTQPEDIIRTPGTESNVKEIYDACNALSKDPENFIFNQFSEMANYIVHERCTGRALEAVFLDQRKKQADLQLFGYVSATGSAGTLAAGDYLKEAHGTKIAAVEALECPTLLYNGYGEHNIQGIGDKHIPYIHNVMNTDLAIAVSDAATDSLGLLFNTDVGRDYLRTRRGVPNVEALASFGFSGIANVLAAVKLAKYYGLGPNQAVVTIATDGFDLYRSESAKISAKRFASGFDAVTAGEVFGEHAAGQSIDYLLELSQKDKERIFNLGYYTWVEQQGVEVQAFDSRRDQSFWKRVRDGGNDWDAWITEFNRQTGA